MYADLAPLAPAWRLTCLAAALLAGAAAAATDTAPAPATTQLRIVGGLADVNQYTRHEAPFWTRTLGTLTQGRVRAEIVPFDRAGIRGQDMLRLQQQGVVPFGTALLGLSLVDDALLGAPMLAGALPDMASLRRGVAALRPALQAHLRQRYGVELLAVYAYPAQLVHCRQAFGSLADLAGRRIRVSSVPQADLVEALGARAVYTPFASMVPQMHSGALDCAITGAMSGQAVGLPAVSSHVHPLPISWGLSVFSANGQAWAALPAPVRELLLAQLPQLEQAIWAEAERETSDGATCITGTPDAAGTPPAAACSTGRPGRLLAVPVTAADRQRLRDALAQTVLPRWVARCGSACADLWNQALAPVTGLRATR